MPTCIDCGKEAPREEMYGLVGELRCGACAHRRKEVYIPRRSARLATTGRLTMVFIGLAVAAMLADKLPSGDPNGLLEIHAYTKYLIAFPMSIWDGEGWRLLTTAFVHGGFLHLLFNCYWMWRFGPSIEAWMGPVRYLAFVVLLAAAPIALEVIMSMSPPVGLSGVVYGMFGLLFAMRKRKDFAAQLADPMTSQVMIGWFFIAILLSETVGFPIANWAHGGGVVLGWLIGRAAMLPARNWLCGGLGIVGVLLVALSTWMPWSADYCIYQANRSVVRGDVEDARRWTERASHAIVPPRLFAPMADDEL